MKKTSLFIACGLATTISIAQIPNSGFENWTTVSTYENPTDWGTMNNTTASYSLFTATKATPGSPGTAYMKLTSKTVNNSVVCGIAVSGKLDTITLQPKSGFAFTQRPANFTGKWQHMIYGSSQGSVRVLTTKWNTTANKRDTIAHAEQTLAGMAMSWANFSMNLTYQDSTQYPDSCIIVLRSSGTNPTNNDYLWADNLAFTGTVAVVVVTPPNPVGLKEKNAFVSNVNVFPNPATNHITISYNLAGSSDLSIQIIDVRGTVVRELIVPKLNSGNNTSTIDTGKLAKGVYAVTLKGDNSSLTKRLIIE